MIKSCNGDISTKKKNNCKIWWCYNVELKNSANFLLNTITPDNFMVFCCHCVKLFCLNTSTHIHFIYNYFFYNDFISKQWFGLYNTYSPNISFTSTLVIDSNSINIFMMCYFSNSEIRIQNQNYWRHLLRKNRIKIEIKIIGSPLFGNGE